MASNATVLKDIDENFLLCSICLDQLKEPKLLPCLHRFCSGCLETLIRNHGVKVSCPLCKKAVIVPKDGFKTDFYLKSIIEYVQFKKSLETKLMKKCFGCSDVLSVTAYCFKCNDFLCQSCRDLHMNNNIAKEHRPHVLELCNVEDNNLSVEKLDSLKDTLRCSTHPEKVADLCCKVCDSLPICMVCGVFGEHKDHKPQEVTSLAKAERKRLDDKLEILMKLKEKVYKMPTLMSEKEVKLDRNVTKREKVIRQQYKVEETKIKSEISQLQANFKMQKKSLNENLQRSLDGSKKELEETIRMLRGQHEKVSAEKTAEKEGKVTELQRENEGEVKQLRDEMEILKNNFEDVNKSVKTQQELNRKELRELMEYYDNVLKRFDNLTITANTILAMKHDWTGVQSIPDILAAVDPLITDVEVKFPNVDALEEAKDVTLPAVEIGRQSTTLGEEIPKEPGSVSHIEGFCSGRAYSVHSITTCDLGIVLSGKVNHTKTFITAVSTTGVKLMEDVFETQHDIPSLVSQSCDSSNKIVTVLKPTEIGIYEIYFGSRIKKDLSNLIRKLHSRRSVTCVAVSPGKTSMIIVGTNSRDLYLFDDMLNYKQTVSLPSTCSLSRDIVFHEGKILLVCDSIEKKAWAVSILGSASKNLYQFSPPTDFEDSDECWPRSICVDKGWLIYILWSSSAAKETRCYLVRYKRYGGKQLWSRQVDADASCIATSVDAQGAETLLLATLNSGRVYKYEIKQI